MGSKDEWKEKLHITVGDDDLRTHVLKIAQQKHISFNEAMKQYYSEQSNSDAAAA